MSLILWIHFPQALYASPSEAAVRKVEVAKESFGDGKFVEFAKRRLWYLTQSAEKLVLFELNSTLELIKRKDFNEAVTWITAAANGNSVAIIVNSFSDQRLRVYSITSECQLVLESIIDTPKGLAIDPTLIRFNNEWIATFTSIEGPINNDNPAGPQGTYTIWKVTSADLRHWGTASIVITRNRNLEDPRLVQMRDGTLGFLYEEEEYDHGPSRLRFLKSADNGESWKDDSIWLDDSSDNEPAGLIDGIQQSFVVFSSDRAHSGKSYQGADGYVLQVPHGNTKEKHDIHLHLDPHPGVLLVDAIQIEVSKLLLAGIENYMGTRQLYWYGIKLPLESH